MSGYFLPSHVHFCQRGDACVFLDLRQDDYTLVNGPAAAALRALSSPTSDTQPARDFNDDLSELLKGGLLITQPHTGKVVAPTRIEIAVEHLVDRETLRDHPVSFGHTLNCLAACAAARASLRWRKIEATVMFVANRKAKHAGGSAFDLARARQLTGAFLKLRGFFPGNYLCLFDSLALLNFLARYGIYPTWVFGVRLEPFAAHCWVQYRHYALNEEVEEAANYTPIMAI
jgi:hypothetical protein